MQWPSVAASTQWLMAMGIDAPQAALLLRASGGRPDDALVFAASGRDPSTWQALPRAMGRGDAAYFKDWTIAQTVDALQKLCHDMMAVHAGSEPRFFDIKALDTLPAWTVLSSWSKALMRARSTMDHPFNAGLLQEALVSQAQTALNSRH